MYLDSINLIQSHVNTHWLGHPKGYSEFIQHRRNDSNVWRSDYQRFGTAAMRSGRRIPIEEIDARSIWEFKGNKRNTGPIVCSPLSDCKILYSDRRDCYTVWKDLDIFQPTISYSWKIGAMAKWWKSWNDWRTIHRIDFRRKMKEKEEKNE